MKFGHLEGEHTNLGDEIDHHGYEPRIQVLGGSSKYSPEKLTSKAPENEWLEY